MQVVNHLTALPGCCWKCRSSNRELYLDTELSVEFYGAVYICDECCREIGHKFGMITEEEAEVLKVEAKRLEDELFEYKLKVSGLEQAIDGLRIAGLAGRSVGVDSGDSSVFNLENGSEQLPDGENSLGIGEAESPESLHDEGMANIPADDSGSSFSLF